MKKKMQVFGEYLGHLLIGGAMFAALFLFGGAINVMVHWGAKFIGDDSFVDLMKVVERIILYADVAFILWWAIYSTYKAIKEMKSE